MQAIRIEHFEMMHWFDKIDPILLNADLSIFLEKGLETLQQIEDLSNFARSHSSREDGILRFLQRLPSLSSTQNK